LFAASLSAIRSMIRFGVPAEFVVRDEYPSAVTPHMQFLLSDSPVEGPKAHAKEGCGFLTAIPEFGLVG